MRREPDGELVRVKGPILLARLATLLPRLAEEYPTEVSPYPASYPRTGQVRYYVETDGADLVLKKVTL